MNITLSYECNSRGIDHYSKYSKAGNCCSLERRSAEVVSIIEVRVWDWAFRMKKTKKCLVSLEKPTQISYWLSLALLLKIDRKGWREWLSTILSFLKLRKAAPPQNKAHPSFPPLMKDPRLASYSFVGRDPRAFFFIKRWFRESTNRQIRSPGDSQPPSRPNKMGWIKSISFLIDSGRSEAKFNQGKGGLTFPDAESSYSNLAMLMEQDKFSDDMDPQEMSENLQLLRGRTLFPLGGRDLLPF